MFQQCPSIERLPALFMLQMLAAPTYDGAGGTGASKDICRCAVCHAAASALDHLPALLGFVPALHLNLSSLLHWHTKLRTSTCALYYTPTRD
jgi:hypothetical protein